MQRPVPAPVAASPELSDRPRRRTFTVQDKLRILAETDRAADTGGVGAILRREGLYFSGLTDWRRQRDAAAFAALAPVRRGPKAVAANPLAAKVALLEQDNARLTRRLTQAEAESGESMASIYSCRSPIADKSKTSGRSRVRADSPPRDSTSIKSSWLGCPRARR